jgi:predicted NBD/HSP70 family sugar kinase
VSVTTVLPTTAVPIPAVPILPVPIPPVPAPAVRHRGPSRTVQPPAGVVLDTARRAGSIFRDELVAGTELSHATVNRQVAQLLEAGLLRERPDLVPAGAVGRPRVPVEVDPDGYGVLGIHIGLRRTTLAAGDLRGRVLGAVEVPNPIGDPTDVLTLLIARLRRFGARWPERRMLRVGLVVGGQLSADRSRLRHPRLGWESAPIGEIVDRVAGSHVEVVPQVEAMAGAETLLARHPSRGTALYVYARETVSSVLTVDGAMPAPAAGLGTISHLPVGGTASCPCGGTGCLEVSVGEASVAAAAHRAGIVAEPSIAKVIAAAEGGHRAAHELLVERARVLGRGVALARDVFNPDRVVLLGQGFTGYRPGLAHVSASFAAASVLEPLIPKVSSLGPGLQALAACTAALRPVYVDPLGAMRKTAAREAWSRPSVPTRRAATR